MASKIKGIILNKILPIAFWLIVWEIASHLFAAYSELDNPRYFFPGFSDTFTALIRILNSSEFIKVVSATLMRVIGGIACGTLVGIVLAIISYKISFIYSLISPLNSVIKATPIASIIILLWISMKGSDIAIFVAFLMVFPIIFQNIYDAFSSIDKGLIEVATIYEFDFKKRITLLLFPALKQYFIPAFITSIGLAFKAEIAAEIIVGVRNSIGEMIYEAKDAPATDEVFAWTFIGVFFSILIESIARMLLKGKDKENKEVVV